MDPLDRLLECGKARGIGEAQIALAEPAEAGAGEGRDPSFLQEDVLQGARIEPGAAHVGKRIEGAAGIDAAEARELAERLDDVLAPLGEGLDHRPSRLLWPLERGDTRIL